MKLILMFILLSQNVFGASELEKSISVSGHCKKEMASDRVSVTLTIEELHKDQKKSSEIATEKYNKILKSVKAKKLKNAEYETQEFSVTPHRPWEDRKQVFKGYMTRISLKISTSEMDKAGELLTLGNDIGQDYVRGPDAYVSDELFDKTYRDCLSVAMEDASSKATIIAKAGKRKLGKVLAVHESNRPSGPPMPMYKAARMAPMAEAMDSAPQIEYGKNKIDVTLGVYFELD